MNTFTRAGLSLITVALAACADVSGQPAPTVITTQPTTITTVQPATTTTTAAPTTTTTIPATLPEMPEGTREFAYVTAIEASDGAVLVTADYAQFLTGEMANEAAREAGEIGEDETVPNDYYILNENPRLRELTVAPDAVVLLQACMVDGDCVTQIAVSIDQWVALHAGEFPEGLPDGFQWYGRGTLPYWLILDGETVIGIEEQYLP